SRAGVGVPYADRNASDRRAGRGQDAGRLRFVRPPSLLYDVAQFLRAGFDQDGETAGVEPQPLQALGPLRAPEVLSPLRVAERERCTGRGMRRRRRMPEPDGVRNRRLRILRVGRVWQLLGLGAVTDRAFPRIAITTGDPAGIGPEIAAKA